MIEYQFDVDTLIGKTLGDYRLERLVEHGQKGPVFLARSNAGPTHYLVRFLDKPINSEAHERNDYQKHFRYLASRIAALQHPGILPLLDFGIYKDMPYVVSPNLAIRSLRSHLASNGPMNTVTVGRYLDQIAAALDYAHGYEVFHGNLTLDCIFFRPNGQLVLADLGTRSLLELSVSGKMLSSRSEESTPDQLLGRPTGSYTDVYALGAVLYQLLTGKPVFAGATANEIIKLHLLAAVPPISQRRSDLPAGLDSIIARALAKDPKQRYQQAGALARDYHQVVDPYDRNQVSFDFTSSPATPVQQPVVRGSTQVVEQLNGGVSNTGGLTAIGRENGLRHQATPLPPILEDFLDDPTLKRIPALPKQTPLPLLLEDFLEVDTPKGVVSLKKTPLPPTLEDFPDVDTPKGVPVSLKQTPLPPILEDVSYADALDQPGNRRETSLHEVRRKKIRRAVVIPLLLLLIASSTVGMVLLYRQNAALAGLAGQVTFFNSSKILLGLCIALAIAFTVAFNIISRVSLSTTRHEYAYTILWQLFCALLAPLFLPFDRFSISVSPQVLLLLALSVALWALVDAFLFSAFKHEEASVLSAIFPLNFVFTFVVSVVFFHSVIKPAVVLGFLIIMAASLLIGLYSTRFRPSKGMIFALLYSFFLGVALGFNSEVVKSFSIPPYMFAAFLFPAAANLFLFLRPKRAELRYELQVQWKKILLNAAVMDISFFFLLKAFQLGNVPQVVALSATSTLLTALAGIVVLKESKHTTLKVIAAALATLGIVLVTISAG